MTNSSHLKREKPKQSGPIRNAGTSGPQNGSGAPQDLIAAAGAAVCGVLENGVRTAYAVIDDYLRRGQDAARGIFNDPNRRGSMSDERSNFGGGANGGFGGGFNPWGNNNPMAMMAEQWMSAMRAWGQAWSSAAPGAWSQMGGFPSPGAGTQSRAVALKVRASRPVEVTVNLYPGNDTFPLVAETPSAEGFTAPPLAAPAIARELGTLRVSLEVGDEQPAGRYRGLIRSKPGDTVAGDLIVVIG
jgi:hypothetical protein